MKIDASPVRRRHWQLWVWLSYWLGLFIIMHVPASGLGKIGFRYSDYVFHFVSYFFLVLLGGRYLFAKQRASTATLLRYAALYCVYAAFDEWLQQFVRRTMSLGDWLADASGVLIATLWLLRRSL